jgi:hypothetical protein
MTLTALQRRVINVLRPFRGLHNYVGGGVALNHTWPRLSDDMDIFRDDRNQLPHHIKPELDAIKQAGFSVEITTHNEWMVEAIVRQYGFETRVQWMDEPETCRRFFPALDDEDFGFRLHQADVAVNKVLCAARRRSAPRDAVDLVNIVQRYAPLGPLVWAISGKDASLTPPKLIRDIRSIAFGYADEEIRTVRMAEGSSITQAELRSILDPALEAVSAYCQTIAPIDYLGYLFVDQNEIPMAASEHDVAAGVAKAIPVKDFTLVPKIRF